MSATGPDRDGRRFPLPLAVPVARHGRRRLGASRCARRRRARSMWRSSAPASPGCGPPTTWRSVIRHCGSQSSRRRSRDSARADATAVGPQRSSPPRSPGWPVATAGTRQSHSTGRCRRPSTRSAGSSTAEAIDCSWQKGGNVSLARTPLQLQRARDHVAELREWGFGPEDLQLLDAQEASEQLAATSVLGGTFTPHCAVIHPARLVRGLARAVEAAGVTIFERTPVTDIKPGVARTTHGDVRADVVVRATEGYTLAAARASPGSGTDLLADAGHRAVVR